MVNNKRTRALKHRFKSWHLKIMSNTPTCYIDYNKEDFVVHVRSPLGKYPSDCIWHYPCVYNNKPLILVQADKTRMGYGNYGRWGVHYL